jgi:hypothetical protein
MSTSPPLLFRSISFSTVNICVVSALALFSSGSHAVAQGGPPNVAVVAADQTMMELVYRLEATNMFGQVGAIDAQTMTPTLAQLQAYDAVITWTFNGYHNATLLGDRLADYVDGGGGVVVAMWANGHAQAGRFLQGRWLTGGYEVIVGQSGIQSGPAFLGTVHVPNHPLLAGVSSFDGGLMAWRPVSTALASGAQRIADWSDGKTLVAKHGTIHGRVDLGFYPISDSAIPESWPVGPEGTRLVANALLEASSTLNAVPFCAGDGTAAACPCGNFGVAGSGCANSADPQGALLVATGSASLLGDTLLLRGSGMPNSTAMYLQGVTRILGGTGIPFGDGLRCVGGAIVRLGSSINAAGQSQYPAAGQQSVSVRGGIGAPATRTYQVWYRNAAAFCTPTTFNLSNGVEVTWMN